MNVDFVPRHQRIERTGGMIAWALVAGVLACPARADWPQWGGPTRDFVVESVELAKKWPKKGPKVIWSRQLPAGYSGIVTGGGKLYTMYRDGEDDVVIAMNAKNGDTLSSIATWHLHTNSKSSISARGPTRRRCCTTGGW